MIKCKKLQNTEMSKRWTRYGFKYVILRIKLSTNDTDKQIIMDNNIYNIHHIGSKKCLVSGRNSTRIKTLFE